jgi:hypothetical protein
VNGLVFLLIAVGISAVGSFVLWLRTRRPSSLDSGIDAFQREMRALSPHATVPQQAPRPSSSGARRGRRRPG